jgi:DNA-binding transcriptional ArsR family regulator
MSAATLDATFFALSDPTRRAILARLAHGEMSVQDLIRPFRLTAPAMTKHLKVLERTGLVRRSRRAQWRPCRLEAAPLEEVADWVERYRIYWDASFDRLDAYLREVQKKKPARGAK